MDTALLGNGWEGRVVEGQFPLLEWLGVSGNCSSFLTLLQGSQEAVIQLIQTDGAEADAYIAQWNFAMALSHPHLTRVFAAGRCVIDRSDLVFVVTERSYSTLAKIIQNRKPKADTIREIFKPVLNALSYLHQNGVVHGYINPSNILLADLEPKLSGSIFLIAGSAKRSITARGDYDAPEFPHGVVTGAADIWSIGMSLWEAMIQTLPRWDSPANQDPAVTESLPSPFREIVQDCLRVDPLRRCTIQSILDRLDKDRPDKERLEEVKPIPPLHAPVSVAQLQAALDRPPVAGTPKQTRETPIADEPHPLSSTAEKFEEEESSEPALFSRSFANIEDTHKSRSWVMLTFVVLLAGIALASFLWFRGHKNQAPPAVASQNAPAISQPVPQEQSPAPAPPAENPTKPETSSPATTPQPDATSPTETPAPSSVSQPAPQPPPVADHAPPPANAEGLVAKRVLPAISPGARSAMRAPLEVTIRVSVNEDGAVSNAAYVSPGPGNYFARQAQRAALSWEFTPPMRNSAPERSLWTLRFHFDREKTDVTATEEKK